MDEDSIKIILCGVIIFCIVLWLLKIKKVSDNKDDTDTLDSPAPAADSLISNTHGFENDDLFKIFKVLNHMRWMMMGFMLLIVINILIPMFL